MRKDVDDSEKTVKSESVEIDVAVANTYTMDISPCPELRAIRRFRQRCKHVIVNYARANLNTKVNSNVASKSEAKKQPINLLNCNLITTNLTAYGDVATLPYIDHITTRQMLVDINTGNTSALTNYLQV
ncbi:uncharacterized protein PHALS_11286 [Plasmopara halstedii]|uniref:Uncharacterized protein n=1 Tax=Plasmopara halstedii TaxID=4781 RepID=A0A0P1AIT6_PLAHL|nr:uncharacterized protein PHALS_11286 [Plasmopara halstedii]CEG41121.1 hypothetical protein PHALS_11286 [Plasmopara halstedii]|eukprot:XP_024577490.1 hypothetical protein PHALS_11286 [Plasmopara halstedii]